MIRTAGAWPRVLGLFALSLLAALACTPLPARAAGVADATGRVVAVPDKVARVLPANLAAAVLVEALAPDLLVGWPQPLDEPARALLSDHPASLSELPARDVQARAAALKPDLVVQYGGIGAKETDQARTLAAQLHVPMVTLDAALRETPHVLRVLGQALQRQERAETLAHLAEAMLAMAPPGGEAARVLYARGTDGLDAAPPDAPLGTDVSGVFEQLGWTVLAPHGPRTSLAEIAKLDPDIIVFESGAVRDDAKRLAAWRGLRAVQQRRAFVAPSLPFGWIARPASLNRLLGLAWLAGADPVTAAAMFGAVVYGRAPTAQQLGALRVELRPVNP